ncbi:hypothetical protein M1349_04150 [Patescibacteria group bacterium]|nr:hypothetical protein [Patescibacteria group bacterium]
MKKIEINENQLKMFYLKNKTYILQVFMIIVSLFLVIFVLIPGIQNFMILREEAGKELSKLKLLKDNLNTLTQLDEGLLDNQLKIAKQAVPPGKDFASILSAVSIAAAKSNVSLGDFEFQVGDLIKNPKNLSRFPTLELLINVNTDLTGTSRFIKEIERTLPFSGVVSVKNSGKTSAISLIFYYKPLPPVNIREDMPFKSVTAQEVSLLTSLSTWNNVQQQTGVQVAIPQSSSSGTFSKPF